MIRIDFNNKEIETPKVMGEITDETKDAAGETAETLEDLKKNPEAFNEAQETAKALDFKSRLKNLKKNSNNC
jgi:hypothetical protein